MEKGKAFILVGHSNWGKSRTLHKLISPKIRGWWQLKEDIWIFVKTMSNDDVVESLVNFVKSITPSSNRFVIIALCPDFNNPIKKTKEILTDIESKYVLFFFVLKNDYGNTRNIGDDEISVLKQLGTVTVSEGNIEDSNRATNFRIFIESHI